MSNKKNFLQRLIKQRYLFLMSIPIVIWLIIFAYIPLSGWSYAFVSFTPGKSVFDCDFVGLKYFMQLINEKAFLNAFRNTIIMSGLSIVFCGFLCPLIFALLITEVRSKKLKKIVQTASYLPHFVSWVVVSGIVAQMLSMNGGFIYEVLVSIGLVEEGTNIMGQANYFYGIYTISNIWKELGWNAIIYISAIAGIDLELYEAASVDGASRLRKIWNITLPGISNTIIILLVMNIGHIVSGAYEAQMLLSNSLTIERAEVLGLYILNYGISLQRFSAGTAAGIITSLISLVLVLIANFCSKKLTDQSLF